MAPTKHRVRREHTEEDIEDDGHSQRRLRQEESVIQQEERDVDDEDEEKPRRPGKSKDARKAKLKAPVEAVAEGSNDVADEEVEDPLRDFHGAPMGKKQLEKLKGLASDWTVERTNIHEPAFRALNDVATTIVEFEDEDSKEVCLSEYEDELLVLTRWL